MFKTRQILSKYQVSDIPCMTSTSRCNVAFTFTDPVAVIDLLHIFPLKVLRSAK